MARYIKNKDWNQDSKGKPNLQTIFWNELFSSENLFNTCYKLNGEAEIFERPFSIKQKILKDLKTKNNGAIVSKRFTENKTFLHVPITINFGAKEINKFNEYLQEKLDTKNLNYLGIDRGENHLLYYSITNCKGVILDQGSLNSFNGVDYERLLNKKEEERKDTKDKWAAIGNIKDIKAGYLSLAVGKIIRLAIKNNALIVLENLNYGFKKSRTIKFEKSVYQKFEVALATKLQHVVLKEKQPHELGGSLNGLQLCPQLDITKLDTAQEWGIIKYVGASYTSRICPLTGWHKTKYLKKIEDIKAASNPDLDDSIKIDFDVKYKCYTFDDRSGNGLIYAHNRLVRNWYDKTKITFDEKNQEIKGVEINNNLEKILGKFKVNGVFDQSEMWATLSERDWKNINYYFDLICNIRVKQKGLNGEKIDTIQSPILCTPTNCIFPEVNKDFEPVFFDTQTEELNRIIKILGLEHKTISESNELTTLICPLPQDGDANGAYHIAKKVVLTKS